MNTPESFWGRVKERGEGYQTKTLERARQILGGILKSPFLGAALAVETAISGRELAGRIAEGTSEYIQRGRDGLFSWAKGHLDRIRSGVETAREWGNNKREQLHKLASTVKEAIVGRVREVKDRFRNGVVETYNGVKGRIEEWRKERVRQNLIAEESIILEQLRRLQGEIIPRLENRLNQIQAARNALENLTSTT